MAEENKRKRTLVKVGEQSKERYDSYGHKIEKPVSRPAVNTSVPRRETRNKEVPSEKSKAVKKVPQKTESKSQQKRKIYSSVPTKELPSHERRIRERKPKRIKNISNIVKAALAILLIAGIACLFIFSIGDKNNGIEQAFLSTGTIEHIYNAQSQIIREEYSVSANFSGKLIAAVNDGDRVAAGATIGYVVKPEFEEELVSLRNTEDKIKAAQNAASYVENQHTEFGTMNEEIGNLTVVLSGMSSETSGLSGYSDAIKQLNALFETKHEIMMNAETTDAYITSLKNERTHILSNLQNYMQEVKTSHAGVVSFYADNKAAEATQKVSQISEYISKKGETGNFISESALKFEASELSYTVGADISAGQTVTRITPDVTYYITADVTGLDYSVFKHGKEIIVRAKSRDFSVEATVEETLKFGDKTYVLLKSSTGLVGSVSQRVIDSELIINHMEGLKVPKRALAEWDSAGLTARIAVLRANYVSYVYVNVLAADGEYAIISPSNSFVDKEAEGVTSVRVNDIYIVNHEKVSDGQIIGG